MLSEFCELVDLMYDSLKSSILGMFTPWRLANTINLCLLYWKAGCQTFTSIPLDSSKPPNSIWN